MSENDMPAAGPDTPMIEVLFDQNRTRVSTEHDVDRPHPSAPGVIHDTDHHGVRPRSD
ncbi:hypothetical protein AB0346_25385 [Nocardia beijingensis]|uniref:hypothetical protein n=1 Tax=Nocardia beijingensis TaxID=95162 RepID=UPI00344B87B7